MENVYFPEFVHEFTEFVYEFPFFRNWAPLSQERNGERGVGFRHRCLLRDFSVPFCYRCSFISSETL